MIKHSFLILLSLCLSFPAFAIPEVNYAQGWSSQVAPFIQTHGFYSAFKGTDGKRINYAIFKNAPGSPTLVIVSGRSDAYLKYSELIYDLYQRGFSVFIFDHRGQGLSERLVADPQVGYVRYFKDYVSDLSIFMDSVVRPQATGPIHLYGHSMGGAITTLYLAGQPKGICSTVLSSAMFEAYTNPYPYPVAIAYLILLNTIGRGKKYAPGNGPYVTSTVPTMTHSVARDAKLTEITLSNPTIELGGPSNRWALASVPAGRSAEKLAKKISTPLLVVQGGADSVVNPQGAKNFCAASAHCEFKFYSGAYHVIWAEEDPIRDDYILSLDTFLKGQNSVCAAAPSKM